MHDDVQPNYVVDSHTDYTNDSNMILYDQYVKDNAVSITQSNVSYVPNDAYMMIINEMHELSALSVSTNRQHKVVNASLTAELATYKEQEDTLEIAKITRKKINDKMKDPECVKNKVKIAPHDYLKENYFATFTPQKQLTPDQIFWSKDLLKMKVEALKEQTTASRTIKALTVYPPNTPVTLVLRKHSDANPIHDLKALDSQNKELHAKVNALYDFNERWRVENEKVKRHYKELYDSIKRTCAKTIKKTNSLLTEVANLKAQIKENHKSNCVTMPAVKSKVLAPHLYVIDVEPIPPRNRNNREVHLDYLKHHKESVATLREIVEEARVEKPLDISLAYACLYTKHSQELVEYIPICYDDDEEYTIAIIPKEPEDSLRMGDEHLDTIPKKESDEFIKFSVENLILNPSESEDLSDSECDVPVCDNFTTFSNLLFDADDDFSSSDDELFFDEDIPKEIYSNPLFDEEIISTKIDPHHFNAEYDLIESLLNHDSLIISSSSKIDSLLDEFAGELTLLCWNIILNGNKAKSMTIDNDGNLKIRPPVTAEEHQQVQREEKARTILLSALPDEHMGDFYHMIDDRDIWNAIKARFGGLEYISFDDLYNKLKFLKINTKRYLSSSSTLFNDAFVSTARLSQGNLSYQESGNGGYTTTHSVSPGSSSSKGSSESKCNVVDDVIYSFFVNHEIDQHLVYEDLDQMNKEDFKEYDLKHQMAMLSIKVHKFEKKHGLKIKFNGRKNARFDKKLVKCFNCKQKGHFLRECRAQGGQNSNNYKKYKSKEAGTDGSDLKAMVIVDGSID
nr:ribonuclease H-like domain-containing protein [Tanacetum cinerariifolium]